MVKSKTDTFVTFDNCEEFLITTRSKEKEFLREYFDEGGRTIHDYDREEYPFATGLRILTSIRCRG